MMSSILFSGILPQLLLALLAHHLHLSVQLVDIWSYMKHPRHSDPAKGSLIFSQVQNQVALSKYAHRLFGQLCVLFTQSCPTLQHQGL